MTRRDDLQKPIFDKITQELGRPVMGVLRYNEVFQTTIVLGPGLRTVLVIVKRHPSGENPDYYQGRESWTVEIFDDEDSDEAPELIARLPDAQESLELALQRIDWDQVRAALKEE